MGFFDEIIQKVFSDVDEPMFRIIDVSNVHDRIYVVEQSPGIHSALGKNSALVVHVKKWETWGSYFTDTS